MNRDIALTNRRHRLDQIAIGLSGLCVAHCVATSLVFAAIASAGGFLLHPLVHEIGLILAIAFGALSLGRGFLSHGALRPLAVGLFGLAFMAFALTLPHNGSEAAMTIFGAAILALGHYLNRRAFA